MIGASSVVGPRREPGVTLEPTFPVGVAFSVVVLVESPPFVSMELRAISHHPPIKMSASAMPAMMRLEVSFKSIEGLPGINKYGVINNLPYHYMHRGFPVKGLYESSTYCTPQLISCAHSTARERACPVTGEDVRCCTRGASRSEPR